MSAFEPFRPAYPQHRTNRRGDDSVAIDPQADVFCALTNFAKRRVDAGQGDLQLAQGFDGLIAIFALVEIVQCLGAGDI